MSLRNRINILITSLIILALGYIFYHFDLWEQIIEMSPIYFFIISFLIILSVYVNGIFLKIVAGSFNIDLKEHFLISLSSSFFNLIIPFKGGLAIRAAYMKKKYGYAYANFAASIFGNYVVLFLVASVLAIILLLLIYFEYRIFNFWFLALFCVILTGTLLLVFCHIELNAKNVWLQRINKVMIGWKLIAGNKRVIFKLSINTLISFVIQALIVQFAFIGLGLEMPFIKALFITVMSLLGVFLSITPGSLGLTEALYVISGTGLGIDPSISLLVSIVLRGVNTTVLAVLGPIANWILIKRSLVTASRKESL